MVIIFDDCFGLYFQVKEADHCILPNSAGGGIKQDVLYPSGSHQKILGQDKDSHVGETL